MLRQVICLLLAATLSCHGGDACNLTQTLHDSKSGLLHRCLNSSGTNEWHENVACWLRPLSNSSSGDILELEVGEKYRLADGRDVAECRSMRYRTALVYHVCLDGAVNDTKVRWPGDLWTGDDGLQYTCTNASLAASSSYFHQSSRVVLFGCNSTASGRMFAPGSSELQEKGGIESRCVFSGTERRDPQYLMEAVGCWLESRSDPGQIVRLTFGEDYSLPEAKDQPSGLLATCTRRYYKQALVYRQCIESINGTSGEVLHQPGSAWNGSDGIELECLPADLSELASARTIQRACFQDSTLFSPGSEARKSDGSVIRCIFSRYKAGYGWFETVGCWLKEPFWSRVTTDPSVELRAGEEFCLSRDKPCLARCEKRRYREEVALLAMVCFGNIDYGSTYRLPHENWTDASGVDRTCIPMADQSSKFGVGAEAIVRGCASKDGHGTVPPGTLFYGEEFIVYECAYNSYYRQYNFKEMAGCWMHDSSGERVRIASDGAFKLATGQTVATCRKKSYSSRVTFTVEVCFKGGRSTPLSWDNSSIALPREIMTNGSHKMECDPAATYSDGVDAKWILYGCPAASGVESPGSDQMSDYGIVWACAHNKREGMSAAYSWVNPIGCWFQDHLNQTIVISQFNAVYQHPAVGKNTARCDYRRYSDPKLRMLVCFSIPNSRFYAEGDEWTDEATGLAKQCVAVSRYRSSDGLTTIDAGCWLTVSKTGRDNSSSAEEQLLAANGSVAYGSKNRVLRCDFNEYDRKYEWQTSVACWHAANGKSSVLPVGEEFWSNGILISKCHSTRKGAVFTQYACEHNGTWHAAMSTWRDSSFWYRCRAASGSSHAETEKIHCITDDGTAIDESQKVNGVQYVCMRVCGYLVFFREPTSRQYQFLFDFVNNCHMVNMNIVNNIG